MSASMLSLNCLVLGDDIDYVFTVKLHKAENVSTLKKLIKDKNANSFKNLDAKKLILWKVSLPTNDLDTISSNIEHKNYAKLSPPTKKLSEFFDEAIHEGVQIVVIPPLDIHTAALDSSQLLSLNCLICGDDPDLTFTVEILKNKNVSILRDLIKEKKAPHLNHVAASELKLWKVPEPVDDDADESLKDLNVKEVELLRSSRNASRVADVEGKESLSSMEIISDLFSDVNNKHLHIVVRPPRSIGQPLNNLTQRRQMWTTRFTSRAPSEMGKPKNFATAQTKSSPAFYFNRPPSAAATVPVTLYDKIFSTFQDECETYVPTRQDNEFVQKFALSMSGFYDSEKQCAEKGRSDLQSYGLDFQASRIKQYMTDGEMRCGDYCISFTEYKQEISSGGAEPVFQSCWYYAAFTRDLITSNKHSNLPCLILYVFGAYIGFAGAVWTDKPHVQVLCPVLPLFYHATDTKMRERAARCFGAAKKAILALKYYYEVELLDPANHRNPAFPYQTNYLDVDKKLQQFTYLRAVDDSKLVFQCMSNSSPLCVKYVRRYSEEVHRESAEKEFAPTLRGFQGIGGGWFIVVMDWVGDEYQLLDESPMKDRFFPQVKDNLTLLHQTGFVHGDIRPSNIMVRKDGEPGIILLDFDWAGKIGEVRYPMNINFVDIHRPTLARDGELILADHDMEMVNLLPLNT